MSKKMTKVEESIHEQSEKINKVKRIVKERTSSVDNSQIIPETSTFVAILLKQKVYKIVQFFTVIYYYFPIFSPNFQNVERTRKLLRLTELP